MQQINIVISGFDPYEGVDVNPAMLAVSYTHLTLPTT